MLRQGLPAIDLFIEQDTDRTPEPKKFYVIHDGQILGTYASLKSAQTKYAEVKAAVGYVPPSVDELDLDEQRRKVIMDEWFNATEGYWNNSSKFGRPAKTRTFG